MESKRTNGYTIVLGNEEGTKHLLLLVVLCLSCLLVVVAVVVRRGIAAGLPNAMQCCVVTRTCVCQSSSTMHGLLPRATRLDDVRTSLSGLDSFDSNSMNESIHPFHVTR